MNSVNLDRMLFDYNSGKNSMLEQINAEDSSDDSIASKRGKEEPLTQKR